jgi:hypothetical protein
MILSTIDGTIVATALPTIAADLGNEELRSWVITTYLLALIATMPLYGKLGDLYGRKRVYITAISIFTVGSMLCGAAGSMEQLLVARFIQGIGAELAHVDACRGAVGVTVGRDRHACIEDHELEEVEPLDRAPDERAERARPFEAKRFVRACVDLDDGVG